MIIEYLYWIRKGCCDGGWGIRRRIDVGIHLGTRQDYVVFHLLFNLYSDSVFKKALADSEVRIPITVGLLCEDEIINYSTVLPSVKELTIKFCQVSKRLLNHDIV